MVILKDRITIRGLRTYAVAFAIGPAVIRAGHALVNLLPNTLTDIVDEQATGAGLHRKGEGIAQSKSPNGTIHARHQREKWVVGWNRSIRIEAQDFSQPIVEGL